MLPKGSDGPAKVAQFVIGEGLPDGRREGPSVTPRDGNVPRAGNHYHRVVPLDGEPPGELDRSIEDDLGGLAGLVHEEDLTTDLARARINTAAEGRVRTDFYIHTAKRHAVYLRNAHTCQCCGYHDATKTGENLSIEHITARSRGGEVQGRLDEPSHNLSTLCLDCNTLKNDNTPKEFNRLLAAKGATHGFDVQKLRAGSKRKLDLTEGKRLAGAAVAYRAANKIALAPKAEAVERAAQKQSPEEFRAAAHAGLNADHVAHGGGPDGTGICHDEKGQFTACRLAVVHRARDLLAIVRSRIA